MENEEDRIYAGDDLRNMPFQTEDIAYKAEEMVRCGKCSRVNSPARLKCLYCGGELDVPHEKHALVRPNLRRLENWEKGFNLIYAPGSTDEKKLDQAEAAKLLHLDTRILQKVIEAGAALPIARAESEKEAEIVSRKLEEYGLTAKIVSDEALAAETPPTRLRGLEFDGEKLVAVYFNVDEVAEIRSEDLALIVSGAVFERKTESIEKRKKGENKILDASETASDEILIDIYTRQDGNGFRIPTKGFDFSCLGVEKGITAAENMKKLVAALQKFAPDAKFAGDYLTVREILCFIWENEQRKDSQGLKRHGFGQFDFSNVATSSNLQQFTKYSRLQWQIL
jgi:hypothetical protein